MCLKSKDELPHGGFHHSCHNLVEGTPKPDKSQIKKRPYSKIAPPPGLGYTPSEPHLKRAKLLEEAKLKAQKRKAEESAAAAEAAAEADGAAEQVLLLPLLMLNLFAGVDRIGAILATGVVPQSYLLLFRSCCEHANQSTYVIICSVLKYAKISLTEFLTIAFGGFFFLSVISTPLPRCKSKVSWVILCFSLTPYANFHQAGVILSLGQKVDQVDLLPLRASSSNLTFETIKRLNSGTWGRLSLLPHLHNTKRHVLGPPLGNPQSIDVSPKTTITSIFISDLDGDATSPVTYNSDLG